MEPQFESMVSVSMLKKGLAIVPSLLQESSAELAALIPPMLMTHATVLASTMEEGIRNSFADHSRGE